MPILYFMEKKITLSDQMAVLPLALVEKLNLLTNRLEARAWGVHERETIGELCQELPPLITNKPSTQLQAIVQPMTSLLIRWLGKEEPPPQEEMERFAFYHMQFQRLLGAINTVEQPQASLTLLLAISDQVLANEISQQVIYFGYDCVSFKDLDSLLQYLKRHSPNKKLGALILDTVFFPDQNPAPLLKISQNVPILFISEKSDVATRLFAVRAKGQGYFVKPIEFMRLIEKIDEVVSPPTENPPYRILIIEDSMTQAHAIKKYVEQAGMIGEILKNPFKVYEVLVEFQPDLILLDLYMPTCSGDDLAKVIRQQDIFVSIPIVYLSAEDDTDKKLLAMKGVADDFLSKPISPTHLISSVIARAERSRMLRREMIQDSLTGLLNHTRILEQLDLEIVRAKRTEAALSFAMIDIDHFKTVNDSYGHPVGDRVIKGLARLLKQRLRHMDSIGRYGGEEFALILPQTSAQGMFKTLDEIRAGFSKLLHRSSDTGIEFSITFSIGLAELSPDIDTVDKLVQAADKALYLAKAQGRNCVALYKDLP